MFRSGYVKKSATVNFTIHEMRVPEEYPDEFFIKWKRGSYNGMTERSIITESLSVFFENKFTCKVTLFAHKKDGSIKPKFITFQAFRLKNGKDKKIFGECEIDVARGFQHPPITETIPLLSPHSQESQLMITFNVQQDANQIGKDAIEVDLTSTSEVQYNDDKSEHWDFSDLKDQEDQERIQSFFDMRKQIKQESALSQFGAIPSARSHQKNQDHKLPLPETHGQHRRTQSSSQTNLFEAPQKPPTPPEKEKSESNDLNSFFSAPKAEKPEDPSKLLKSLLKTNWGKSPLTYDGFPRPSIVIYTAFIHTQIISKDSTISDTQFNDLFVEFMNRYKDADIIINATHLDHFIITLYLMLLINSTQNAIQSRVDQVVTAMREHLAKLMTKIVDPYLKDFEPLVDDLVSVDVDPSNVTNELVNLSTKIEEQLYGADIVKTFLLNYIMRCFDDQVVRYISTSPQVCTFTAAVQWNSTNTVLSERGFNFLLFREAAAVIMMAQILCTDPNASKEICPHLKKDIVLKILTNQQPDDFNPMPNDVILFMKTFNIQQTFYVPKCYVYEGDFSDLGEKINVGDWKLTKFDQSTLTAFSFLKKFFKQAPSQ